VKEWYTNLAAREQLVVTLGAVAAAIVLVWGLVWLPLDRGHDDLRADVETWERSLVELRSLAASANAAPPAGERENAGSDDSPMVVVDRTLRDRSLNSAVKRRQPTPNGIRVEFENVAFDDLVVWLGEVQQQHGLAVQAGNLSTASRSGPGRINASITLEQMR
jgi:general secretion pathway protein M